MISPPGAQAAQTGGDPVLFKRRILVPGGAASGIGRKGSAKEIGRVGDNVVKALGTQFGRHVAQIALQDAGGNAICCALRRASVA